MRRVLLPVLAPLTAFGLVLGMSNHKTNDPAWDRRAAAAERRGWEAAGRLKAQLEWDQNVRVLTWTKAVNDHNLVVWNATAAANAEAERQAAAAQRAASSSRSSGNSRSGAASGGVVSGDCYGGTPLSSTLVNNESGGNPNARNPSGAWGCFQIMPATWTGLGCAGTHGSASVEEQKACANKVWDSQGRGAWAAAG